MMDEEEPIHSKPIFVYHRLRGEHGTYHGPDPTDKTAAYVDFGDGVVRVDVSQLNLPEDKDQ